MTIYNDIQELVEHSQYTMYIDMVKREYAVSSTSTLRYGLDSDIATMFENVKSNNASRWKAKKCIV